jgi:hypothetical protein
VAGVGSYSFRKARMRWGAALLDQKSFGVALTIEGRMLWRRLKIL